MSEIFEDLHALNVEVKHLHNDVVLLRAEMEELKKTIGHFKTKLDELQHLFDIHGHNWTGEYD